MKARLVFMGSPEFAVPVLRSRSESYPIAGGVTQPDRPAGRGRELTPPPVKMLARTLGLSVIQPQKLRQPEAVQQLAAWAPDLIVVAAFGQILRQEVLDLPLYGCINVHASLLPRWRGAAPIQAALRYGDSQTGVTIMRMDPGVDTGPILRQKATPITEDDTAGTLSERLSRIGAALLLEVLPDYLAGKLQPVPQDDEGATYAPMLKKEDGELDFTQPAAELERRVRAFNPWPGAFTMVKGQMLKIHRASVAESDGEHKSMMPGQPAIYQGKPAFATSKGLLVLEELQPAGKKPMPGKNFLQGARNWM